MNFEFNLSLVLGHTLLSEVRSNYSPNGVVDDAVNGGDPAAPTVGESTAQQLQALTANLPGLMQSVGGNILPYEQQLQTAQNTIAPQQAQLNADLFAKYGSQLNDIGNQLASSTALSQAKSTADVLNGPGQAALSAADAAQRKLDPEYYATRSLESGKIGDLLNSIDLNGLSGSERAEVERSNAQQDASRGIANSPSQTATVNNAMNFGSALQNKRNALSQAISTATGFLPNAQGPINAVATTTGKSSNNAGVSQFSGVGTSQTGQLGGATNSLASGLLGNVNNTATSSADINANRRDSLDRVTGVLGSLPSVS